MRSRLLAEAGTEERPASPPSATPPLARRPRALPREERDGMNRQYKVLIADDERPVAVLVR